MSKEREGMPSAAEIERLFEQNLKETEEYWAEKEREKKRKEKAERERIERISKQRAAMKKRDVTPRAEHRPPAVAKVARAGAAKVSAKDAESFAAALAIRCPKCSAAPGEHCKTFPPPGRPIKPPHRQRREAAVHNLRKEIANEEDAREADEEAAGEHDADELPERAAQ